MVEDLLDLDGSTDTKFDPDDDQDSSGLTVATTCTQDGCDRQTHERLHERNPQLGTKPHPDAPTIEAVCPRHGLI